MGKGVGTFAAIGTAVSFLLLGLGSTVGAAAPSGSVTIVTKIDFSSFPFHGTFTVAAGASVLGCSQGTFADRPVTGFNSPSEIEKTFTCTAGANGSFTASFRPTPRPGPGIANGHWEIVPEGTGAYTNLRGGGDFSLLPLTPPFGQETLTGVITFFP
jgi:hypothetical protein